MEKGEKFRKGLSNNSNDSNDNKPKEEFKMEVFSSQLNKLSDYINRPGSGLTEKEKNEINAMALTLISYGLEYQDYLDDLHLLEAGNIGFVL